MMSEIIEQVSNEIASQYDNQIEKALLRCGFTMRYCEEHPEEFLWMCWLTAHIWTLKDALVNFTEVQISVSFKIHPYYI